MRTDEGVGFRRAAGPKYVGVQGQAATRNRREDGVPHLFSPVQKKDGPRDDARAGGGVAADGACPTLHTNGTRWYCTVLYLEG